MWNSSQLYIVGSIATVAANVISIESPDAAIVVGRAARSQPRRKQTAESGDATLNKWDKSKRFKGDAAENDKELKQGVRARQREVHRPRQSFHASLTRYREFKKLALARNLQVRFFPLKDARLIKTKDKMHQGVIEKQHSPKYKLTAIVDRHLAAIVNDLV